MVPYSYRGKYHNPELVKRTIELFSFEKALAEHNAKSLRKIETPSVPKTLPPKVLWLSPVTYRIKTELYVVSIGISDYKAPGIDLDYADDDARAVSRLFAAPKGRLFKNVHIKPCYNDTADRGAIIDALDWLDKKATQKDVIIVFIAAHGYMEKGNYYLLPHDGDPDNLRKTAVRWDDLVDTLGNLPSRILLLLDTCHSGGIDPDMLNGFRRTGIDNTEAIRELASEEYGVVVMAASTGKELSMERKEWGHGAFTKALLEGLEESKADFSGDGIIHLRELDQYISERVRTLTDGKQHPTTQRSTTISRFPLFQLTIRK